MSTVPSRSATRAPLFVTAIGLIVAALVGLLAPSAVVPSSMPGMSMTHYMELLSVRQPWNLLMFMAVPVILAETLAITELVILVGRAPAWVRTLSRVSGLLAGPIMLGILLHLLRYAVLPLTASGGWRGPADVVAVGAYLLGAVPLIAITLVEVGVLGRTPQQARLWHVAAVATFLVIAHVAMIFGMLDPMVVGWHGSASGVEMPGMGTSPMAGMDHGSHTMPGGVTMPGMTMPAATPTR